MKFSDKVLIGIGSSNESNTTENPFSYEERKEMIQHTLKKENIDNCLFFPIPDINNDDEWATHVTSITGTVDIIYTGNDWVKNLFEQKNYQVRNVTMLKGVNATVIRKRIAQNKDWQRLVPIQVAHFLRKINGINRIKKINGIL